MSKGRYFSNREANEIRDIYFAKDATVSMAQLSRDYDCGPGTIRAILDRTGAYKKGGKQ
jgi:hypothetical protein